MKKLFTLALVLLVATAGYSQVRKMSSSDTKRKASPMQVFSGMETLENVQSEPNMVRWEYGAGELDFSYYDWQSNAGPRTWTIVWPDGKVNFAYTIASDPSSYSDRGTGIGTYDSNTDEWIPLGGRIEAEKTGFGSIARYKDNGIVVAAHTANNLGIYIVENKDEMTPNSVQASLYVGSDAYTHPAVMTSGADRDIIHVAAAKFQDYEGSVYEPIRYWRSSDGGQTWDKEYVELPYLTAEYGVNWGTNSYYWMETTESNRLALVVNNSWSDGMVIYSDDNGETWERKVFYHHPGPFEQYTSDQVAFLYPRWTSAQWVNGALCLAYEFNGTNDVATSTDGGYYPGIGGVSFWSETMPYHGEGEPLYGVDPTNPMPPTPGQPFIMDSAYIMEDVYMSWMLWEEQTHEMFPEYMGYLAPLDPDTYQPEGPTIDDVTHNFGIENLSECHGKYNSGPTAMPAMAKVGDNALVAVWSSVDEYNTDGAGLNYYKLFASASEDGGLTWRHQVHLTDDFMFEMSECVYVQAAVVGSTLVVAAQMDGEAGTFVQQDDTDGSDNYYQGLTFELTELFPGFDAVEETVSHNTHMTLYPNPAVDQLNVTLSQNAGIVIYNIMGQAVMNIEGHAGANSINISELGAGIYFISAGSDTQKFIVK